MGGSIQRTTLCLALLLGVAHAFDCKISKIGGLSIVDEATEIPSVKTLFMDEVHNVSVTDLEWERLPNATSSDETLVIAYETFLNEDMVDSGEVQLTDLGRELPTSVEVGQVRPKSKGSNTIRVVLRMEGQEEDVETEQTLQTFKQGVSIIPLLLLIGLAVSTSMIEISLLSGIFVGACMIAGNINDGFKTTFDTFILSAVADVDHGFVYLFTLFLAGLVGMMERSGGMNGFVQAVSKYATTSRAGQLITFAIGLMVFFDDYANTLLAGETMRPLTDTLFISREKLSFIVDATAAPIASLTPISSWVGFEVNLIQTEINRLSEQFGKENLTIETTGMGVFLQSIKYRYYPIFMILLMLALIVSHRDYGSMLIAERRTEVYKRTDGGDAAATKDGSLQDGANKPRRGTPFLWWNMIMPMLLLIFLVFYLLVKSGEDDSIQQNIIDKLQESDSYSALLTGTIGATFLTMIFYFTQIVQDGTLVLPTFDVIKGLFRFGRDDDDEGSKPRLLMSLKDCVESFLHGMMRIFPALIILTLAWAVGDVMTSVGVDRLVSRWITGGLDSSLLPTISFIVSALMALATGTSWGTMSIMFPLMMRATYISSEQDPKIFYSTVAGILSGAVAGDHISPISDTTVLSALACDCQLLKHVATQIPYSLFVSIVAILFGTLPYGRGAWPNIVGILLGTAVLVAFVWLICKPVVNADGSFDILTELWIKVKKDNDLMTLKHDTVEAFRERLNPTSISKPIDDSDGKEQSGEDATKAIEVEQPLVAEEGIQDESTDLREESMA